MTIKQEVEAKFKDFIKKHRPWGAAVKICPLCGRPTAHKLSYCRTCGTTTVWINFNSWLEFCSYVKNKKYKGKYSECVATWPMGDFLAWMSNERGYTDGYAFASHLTRKEALNIIFSEIE